MDDRQSFLIEMYRQMFADINRHLTVVWQSVSVVVGAFALLALSEKNIIPVDIAISLIVILCGWLYAHMLDAGYWYNRNLAIISNIERQFLNKSDLAEIHYYWGAHRSVKNKMITHIRIQSYLGVSLASLAVLFHLITRVMPGLESAWALFDASRLLPYGAALGVLIYCRTLSENRDAAYAKFVCNSPGKHVDTSSITYGTGHEVD